MEDVIVSVAGATVVESKQCHEREGKRTPEPTASVVW